MKAEEQYKKLKNEFVSYFKNYVDTHNFDLCMDYFYFLENHSQEDALLFSLSMIEKYINEFDHDLYDHIACLVFHDGNHSMLYSLIEAEMTTKNDDAKNYYQHLIEVVMSGLQKTSRPGFEYTIDFLSELRKQIELRLK